jgi:hypothetical protein
MEAIIVVIVETMEWLSVARKGKTFIAFGGARGRFGKENNDDGEGRDH